MSIDLNSNYFELFGLPVHFEVDAAQQAAEFLRLQTEHHPDRVASADAAVRRNALEAAALINEANNTLKDPLQRSFYLLKLAGHEMDLDHHTSRDTAFLMQQLEFRERLDDAEGASDPLAIIDHLKADLAQEVDALVENFKQSYESGQWESAMDTLTKWQFYVRLGTQVDDKAAEIEDALFT